MNFKLITGSIVLASSFSLMATDYAEELRNCRELQQMGFIDKAACDKLDDALNVPKVEDLEAFLDEVPKIVENKERVWGNADSCPMDTPKFEEVIEKIEALPSMRKRDKVRAKLSSGKAKLKRLCGF